MPWSLSFWLSHQNLVHIPLLSRFTKNKTIITFETKTYLTNKCCNSITNLKRTIHQELKPIFQKLLHVLNCKLAHNYKNKLEDLTLRHQFEKQADKYAVNMPFCMFLKLCLGAHNVYFIPDIEALKL
jgi:hypothetical protein